MHKIDLVTPESLSANIRAELDDLLEKSEKTSFNDTFIKALTEIVKSPESERSIGPIFEITDKYGNSLRVTVVRTANKRMSNPGDPIKKRRTYFLIAQDENGVPVGIKNSFIDESKDENKYVVKGLIESGKRDRGISTSIELANILYLQSESAKLQTPHVIQMVNKNDQDLDDLKTIYQENPNPVAAEILKRKIQENKRWHAVYGSGGKVGLNDQGRRIITGNAEQILVDSTIYSIKKDFENPQTSNAQKLSGNDSNEMMKNWVEYSNRVKPTIDTDQESFTTQYEHLVHRANEFN